MGGGGGGAGGGGGTLDTERTLWILTEVKTCS